MTKPRIQPRGNLVLVRRKHQSESNRIRKIGTIHLPDDIEKYFFEAVVVQAGPGSYLETGGRAAMDDLQPGSTVLVRDNPPARPGAPTQSHRTIPVVDRDKLYELVMEGDIMAILNRDPDEINAAIPEPSTVN